MKRRGIVKNKGGWIEIVEAFFAVLLVAGVILILFTKGYFGKSDIDDKVYNVQVSILREIQTDDDLRKEVAEISGNLPVKWESVSFPADVKSKIIERTPAYLNCSARICEQSATCILDEDEKPESNKNIYSEFVTISATFESGPVFRKLNLFCWQD